MGINKNFGDNLKHIAVFFLSCLSIYIVYSTTNHIIEYSRSILYFDQWDDFIYYIKFINGSLNLFDLFDQHNEHKIFFPRIIFFIDGIIARADNSVNIFSIYLMQIIHVSIIILLYKKTRPTRLALICGSAISVIMMFSLAQRENFFWGFQVQFVGVGLAATIAFVLFIKAIEKFRVGLACYTSLIWAYCFVTIATFSMSNGIISAVTLVLISILMRYSREIILCNIIILMLLFFAYFLNFHSVPGHSHYQYSLQHPLQYIEYLLTYLGSIDAHIFSFYPFRWHLSEYYLILFVGAIGLVATVFALFRLALGTERNNARIAFLTIQLFVVGTAALTTVGRVEFGVTQALSERYLTPVSVFWLAQIFYWLSVISESFTSKPLYRRIAFSCVACMSLVIISGSLASHLQGRLEAEAIAHRLDYPRSAMLSGVSAPQTYDVLYPDSQMVEGVELFLREHGLSIFSSRDGKALGRPIEESYLISKIDSCFGAIETIAKTPLDDSPASWEVNGWAWNNLKHKPIDRLVFTTQHGKVIGFASGGWPNPKLGRNIPGGDGAGWRGFFKIGDEEEVIAYALLKGDEACRFAQQAPSHNYLLPVPMSSLGPVILAPIHADETWKINGQSPAADKIFLNEPIYGSWSGADSNMGALVIGPFSLTSNELIMPIVTGPHTEGLKIELTDVKTGQVLATYALPINVKWQAFKFNLPEDIIGKSLKMTMYDQGDGWGQWFAVSVPHSSFKP